MIVLVLLWGLLAPSYSLYGDDSSTDSTSLEELVLPVQGYDSEIHKSFIYPNEGNPEKAKSILEQTPQGAYVSVGTERGYIGAALHPNPTHLIFIDRDPEVVRFHRINIALLKIARDRTHYLEVRLRATRSEWLALIETSTLTRAETDTLSDPETWEWWKTHVRDEPKFNVFHAEPAKWTEHGFKNANYLYDDALFLKIQNLARKRAISVHKIDLTDSKAIELVVKALTVRKITISVLDISNAWWKTYLEPEVLARAVMAFKKATQQRSILQMTAPDFIRDDPRASITWDIYTSFLTWHYFGITFDRFTTEQESKKLFESLNETREDQTIFKREIPGKINPSRLWKNISFKAFFNCWMSEMFK